MPLLRGVLVSIILFGFGVALSAQQPSNGLIRTVYQPRHLNAKQLSEALAKLFKNDAEITSLTDSGVNVVLFSATPEMTKSIKQILDELDRKPRLIKVQVALFETTTKPEDSKNRLTDSELKELEGNSEQVFAKLEAFQKEGKIQSLRRVDLSAAENQRTKQMTGSDKAMVMGEANPFGGGKARTSISYRPTGWTVGVTPQLSEDKLISIDLTVDDSQLHTPEDGVNANGVIAQETRTTQLQSKIQLVSGQATVAQGVKTQSKTNVLQTYVVVGTQLVPEAKRGQ
jgi:type II secretory pathway component GspD/PulD (secretin)